MFKRLLKTAANAILRKGDNPSDDESSSDDIETDPTTRPSRKPLLGRQFRKLKNYTKSIEQKQIIELNNDIDHIGRNLLELNKNLETIPLERETRNSISIGDNSNSLENQLKTIKQEQKAVFVTKIDTENNLKILNEKLNSVKSSLIDHQFIPQLGSSMNQLATVLTPIESITQRNDELYSIELGRNFQSLNKILNSILITNEIGQSIVKFETGSNSHILDEKLNDLKNIFYKRYKTKFEQIFQHLKLEYDSEYENYSKRRNSSFEIEQYARYCLKSNKSMNLMKTLLRENLNNDLQFKHHFERFIIQYRQHLFQLILNNSSYYIPKSKRFIQSYEYDEKYNLFQDIEQLESILEFSINIVNLDDLQKLNTFFSNQNSIFILFMKYTRNLKGKNQNYYVDTLKESYLVFIRDYILGLYDADDENSLALPNENLMKIKELQQFNEEYLKRIHDNEKNKKTLFIRKFKGENWNDKLVKNDIVLNEYKLIEFTNEKDDKVDELRSKWQLSNDFEDYSEYENYILNMNDSVKKSEHLFEISKVYSTKKPLLRVYLRKAIDFLNKSISIDQFSMNSSNFNFNEVSNQRTFLRTKLEYRGLIHLRMGLQYDYPCFEKFNYFNMAKFDFLQFDQLTINEVNINCHENNFINSFKNAFKLNDESSIDLYNDILKLHEHFFEAQYQKLLKFYELHECGKIFHFHSSFVVLNRSNSPLIDLFKILINKKQKNRKAPLNEPPNFLNRTIKVKVKNHQNPSLYLKLVKSEYSYQIKYNNQEQLINLLKYGKLSINFIKYDTNKSLKLIYQQNNYEFKRMLSNLEIRCCNQRSNFLQLIDLYKGLELSNESEYNKLERTFQRLLPETRLKIIEINSSNFEKICQISKSMKEFQKFPENEIQSEICKLKYQRANIYRTQKFFYLEELELFEILDNQKYDPEHNPIIYHRLAYLNKQRGNIRSAMDYIDLANRKYYEKINKRIFEKIRKFKLDLENCKSTINNQMNLLQIFYFIGKFDFSLTNGFEIFQAQAIPNSLIDCLFYHLIEDTDDIENYVKNNVNNELSGKYNELKQILIKENILNESKQIEKFNQIFQTDFQCVFLTNSMDSSRFELKNGRIPIVLFQDRQTRKYSTIKRINHFILLTNLLTNYNAKLFLKTICSKFLNDEIRKNILVDNIENKNIEALLQLMADCENMKQFTESIVYYLNVNDYEENWLHFWSLIADLEYYIDLSDTLNYFKQLFYECIEEHRQEEEDKHKSALQTIDDLIERSQNQLKYLNMLNKLKDNILLKLSQYNNISFKSDIRERLNEILSSNRQLVDKIGRLIRNDCLDIDLEFENSDEEENFYKFIEIDDNNEIAHKILLIIEDALAEAKINKNKKNITAEGYTIILSRVINDIEQSLSSTVEEVRLYGTNVFIDNSLSNEIWHGKNFVVSADVIEFAKDQTNRNITINLSGTKGIDGKNAPHQENAIRESEDGNDGSPGGNGGAGENGGNIYLIAQKRLDGRGNIQRLITSGGDGGQGGNGGNGGDGANGKDGENASENHNIRFFKQGYQLNEGKPGTRGGNGGAGGDAGLAGYGGHTGAVHIEENQFVITHVLAHLIESIDKSTTPGQDGLPGEGGRGGEGGNNGNDFLFHRPGGFFERSKKYCGHINVVDYKNTFFKFHLDFEYKKKPKKRNGIDNTHGKAADAQLHIGKNRSKGNKKERSNEQEIQIDSNRVIHNNSQASKTLSKNITNSLNLLKDQLADISDERESIIKRHQLSNSILENARKITKEALAVNEIKLKAKLENTILKTIEDKSENSEKLLTRNKLDFDQSTKELMSFEETNFLSILQQEYSVKIAQYELKLSKAIKKARKEIELLKSKARNILFKFDIEYLHSSYLIGKKTSFPVQNDANSGFIIDENLASFTSNHRSFYYDSNTKSHEPLLMDQYFEQLSSFQETKRSLINIKQQLNKFNVSQFINELCLEYGNKQIIQNKLSKLNELFDSEIDNQINSFNFDHFIDEIRISINNPIGSLEINRITCQSTFSEEICNYFIELDISKEQTDEFLSTLSQILEKNSKIPQYKLNECSPVHHEVNQPIEIHPIEEIIDKFLESDRTNLELIVQMLKTLISIFESDQRKLLCKRKLEQFFQFLFIHIIFMKVDFSHGHLFTAIKRILNSIQMNYSISYLFNYLKLTILIKEKQYNNFKKYLEIIEKFFVNKRNQCELDITLINYIRNNRQMGLFNSFKNSVNINEMIEGFLENLFLEREMKDRISHILNKFNNYLTDLQQYDYNYLISNQKAFFEKLNFFIKQEKANIRSNFDDLLSNKDRCQTIIHLLYRNANLQIDNQDLKQIDASDQTNVNEFIEKFRILYDKFRLEQILSKKKEQPLSLNLTRIDYNKNICQLLLTLRNLTTSDRKKIQNAYQIILVKEIHFEPNRFKIYFRSRVNSGIENILLDKNDLVQLLNNLHFDPDALLKKDEDKSIYKMIYDEVQSKNGFTQYSLEQIQTFEKLKDFIDENLLNLSKYLHVNIFNDIENEIVTILNDELPEFWSFQVYFIFNDINIVSKLSDKFPNDFNFDASKEIEKRNLNNSDILDILKQSIDNLFETVNENRFIHFYQCLRTFDYLLVQILNDELNISIDDIYKTLNINMKGKTDLQLNISCEIELKFNLVMKEYFFSRTIEHFDELHVQILDQIDQDQVDLQDELRIFFKQWISNRFIDLFNSIDNFYIQTMNKINSTTRYEIYNELLKSIKNFTEREKWKNSREQSNLDLSYFTETLMYFINYLEHHCLMMISGISTINYKSNQAVIKQLMENLKTNYENLEKCELKILLNANLDHIDNFNNEIICNRISENEIRLVYRTLIEDKIELMILRKDDDDERLFDSLNIEDDTDYIQDKIYSFVKSKNGSIYKNQYLFESKIFIDLFCKEIFIEPMPDTILKEYFYSFEFLFQNSKINFDILFILDEYYQNFKRNQNNQQLQELFDRFDKLIDQKYEHLITRTTVDFNKLIGYTKQKNRILNLAWQYLQSRNAHRIEFERNQLIRTTFEIKTILTNHRLEIKDFIHCSQQLNQAIIKTPAMCLQLFENQLKILQLKMRLFIINVDYTKDCQMKERFEEFNQVLRRNKNISNQSILNLLNDILKNKNSLNSSNYEAILNKVLLNLKINNEQLDLEMLRNLEIAIKEREQIPSIRETYIRFIVEQIKQQLLFKYNQQLKQLEDKYKYLSDSIEAIIDLFWSNVTMSDLLNKEREKTYLHVNIEKLLKLSNKNRQDVVNDVLKQIRDLQFNSNKKQFTNDVHHYLNTSINNELINKSCEIDIPIDLNIDLRNSIVHVLNNEYNHHDRELILDELSILFEAVIDNFQDEIIFNDFFRSFTNVFQYFSWRLCEYQSKDVEDKLQQSFERFNASIKIFKTKLNDQNIEKSIDKYCEFHRFEKIYYLRTNENQLQQELNNYQNENKEKLNKIAKIQKLWLSRLDNYLRNIDEQLVTSFARDLFSKVENTLFDDKTILDEFYSNEVYVKEFECVKLIEEFTNVTIERETEILTDEEKKSVKVDFKDKISLLNKITLNLISKKSNWTEEKDIINNFDLAKGELIDKYLKTIYENYDETSVEMQSIKGILMECDTSKWDEEIYYLSTHLFIKRLLEFYGFSFDVLAKQYDLIDDQIENNQENFDLNEKWQTDVKENNDLLDTIDFIKRYASRNAKEFKLQTSLVGLMVEFINNVKVINEIKLSIDALQFFVSSEQFDKLIQILERHLINCEPIKFRKEKLSDLFNLLLNCDNFNRALGIIDNFSIRNWLLYLNMMKIESDLNILFNRYLDELNFNNLQMENLTNLDESIELEYNNVENRYKTIFQNITNTLQSLELNRNIESNDKEIFLQYIRTQLSSETKNPSTKLISLNDLDTLFNKYLMETNIIIKISNSLNNQSLDINETLIIADIRSKSLYILLPCLYRFWIIETLQLNSKVLENEATKIIEYLEIIKTSYSDERTFELIDLIKISCNDLQFIPQTILDLLMNISNNEWMLDKDIMKIIETETMNNWIQRIENYVKEKRSRKRDNAELIKIMRNDKNNLNDSIKAYLNSSTIFEDFDLFETKLKQKIHPDIDKPVEKWDVKDIQRWSKKIKGNKLLLYREQVHNAIVVVSQAVYLFTGKKYRPRETQIIALWLFLNPDLNRTNMGCLAQISTGEGKSIIVASLAAIKALSCHRIDIITSSSVLAIRDSEEFQSFFEMFGLQVSNNCDASCEQGDGKRTAEDIRKSRYYNECGPVDIVYGECSCFERDILLTEFSKNDESQNIVGQRVSQVNCVSSVIVDEVDSMLLDKANMVLYLSHNIDTLKALERIFVSIWQIINQPTFDHIEKNSVNDDLIEFVSDTVLQQIENKALEIPQYDSKNCDYMNMKMFIKRRLPTWIKSAFHVREMIPNDEYIITRDKLDKSAKSEVKITVMDKDTGTEQLSTRWSNGVHQFLQLKHTRRLTPESLKAVFISNMSFFKRYQHNIIGLTGSLGSNDEQNLLNRVYKVRFFELPRFKQELFRELPGSVHTDQDTWLEAIKNALDREIKSKFGNQDRRRAVLMICENVKTVLVLKEYLSNSYPNAKVYKSAYEKFEVDEMRPGDIIVATNLAGRGTDLNTSEKLEDNGGLHVITTYMPTNIRVEMQAFGRTARKGNKGTGEYILLSRYGLSIQRLKQWRNETEKERLSLFLTNDLPRIEIEEELLQGIDDDSDLSCLGFTKLYEAIETKLGNDVNKHIYGDDYVKYQLSSLKNRWAFWLDSMNEHINMINIVGKRQIIEKFKVFQMSIETDFDSNDFNKLIIEPAEFIKLGKYYRDKEDWSKALSCYSQASKDTFYSFANYYAVSCQQNLDYVKGIASKKQFKHSINAVQLPIEKEIQFLNTAAQLAFEIGEKHRQIGYANYGNEYQNQVKEKLTIWGIFSSSITNAIGSPIEPKDLTSTKYLCDEKKAERLFNKLQEKEFIKPIRISKKIDSNIELPSIFNNKRTKEQLFKYLNKKSQERKQTSGHLNELNSKMFKDDLKHMNVFLPYINNFIDLLIKEEFIRAVSDQNQEPVFVFRNFVEEILMKKEFPKGLSNSKETLFSCTKEFIQERPVKSTRDEFLNEFKKFFQSKHPKTNLTDIQFTVFYEFLVTNSCLEKVNVYSVIRENIIIKNKDLKNLYLYGNLYDLERHYTQKFKEFESIFQKSFLKIILIQKDFEDDGDDDDDDNSYFTLKETIDSSEFELSRNEDEAIDYLWSYLKSNSFIKLPSVNIGLIESKEVKERQEKMKKEIKSFFEYELSEKDKEELDEAVNSTFNLIDQTLGDLKKLPDDKTIVSYLQIKTSYFLDSNKIVPDALDEFIELALDVIFRLEEKKEPPKWYEIAAVIAFGVLQVVAGVLIKTFVPIAGQLIGEFLISTGCDDILFGVQCALTGEFSWEKYWEHKKRSMITSAITAIIFVGVSFLKNAKRLGSLKKAWQFQKLSHAKRLHTAATALSKTANIGKHVAKEITKTLVHTGLGELASFSIDHVLDAISNTYETELTQTIKKSVNENWDTVEKEMKEIYRLSKGSQSSLKIIEDCIARKLQHLPEVTFLKNFASRCGPVMQGLGKALANSGGMKGTLQRVFTFYAPSLIHLGVNIREIWIMISGFMKSLTNDLIDTRKKLTETDKKYVLKESQINELKNFQKRKIDQIANSLSESFNQKLKSGIIAPVLNFAANKLIGKGMERVAGANRIEALASTFELIHAASNPNDTKTKYADDLSVFLAEAQAIDLKELGMDPKEIYPGNLDGQNLEDVYDLYGPKVKTFLGRDGKIYVRRPTMKDYHRSVRGDKPAGSHEQQKVSKVLGCTVEKGEISGNEQKCILKREGCSDVTFVIRNNQEGANHAEIIVDGQSITVNNPSGNKNDCYYNVVLVANEMSKHGIQFAEAVKILDDKNIVQNLRNDVSLAMKNDERLLNEFRWTNQTDLRSHFNSLTGLCQNPENGNLEMSDDDVENIKEWINRKKHERPEKFARQLNLQGKYKEEKFPVTFHHFIAWEELVNILKTDIQNLTNQEIKTKMEGYLNHPNNQVNKEFILNEMVEQTPGRDVTRHNLAKDKLILRQAIVWNPNLVIPGPPGDKREADPDHTDAASQKSRIDNEIVPNTHKRVFDNGIPTSNALEIITELSVNQRGAGIWRRNTQVKRGKFIYHEDSSNIGVHPYLDFKRLNKNDGRILDVQSGTLN